MIGATDEQQAIAYLLLDIREKQERIGELESALREIRDHPHGKPSDSLCTGLRCTDKEIDAWRIVGQIQGHRCAAEIARKALEKK